MTFTAPIALLLLLVLFPVIWIGLPRLAYRRRRDLTSLIIRIVIVTLVVLALAGVQTVRAVDQLAVVFVVDASDSMGSATRDAQIAYIESALAAMLPDDQASVIVFGGDAVVERAMSRVRQLDLIRSAPNTGNTDIEEAINLGLALFPAGSARRMVIMSDGLATLGDAERAARRAAATGVEISYVDYERATAPEILLSDIRVPTSVGEGQNFDLDVTVEADAPAPATITVEAGGVIVSRENVELAAGVNNFTLSLTAGETGLRDFRVVVTPLNSEGDGFYQNNLLSAFSRVTGAPRVLIVASAPEEAQYIADALNELGIMTEISQPSGIPLGLAALAGYQAVVMANVAATELSTQRMENLQTYVRDLGGGLVVSGGPDAFAVGGYFRTPLEETLPIDMQIRDQQRIPQLTITYVIDRSGSMAMVGDSGVANLDLAKEAILRSLEFLQPTDNAGVVSFDANAYWVADLQPVFDRSILQYLVGTLQSGGGTDIMAGMQVAAEAIVNIPSERKHIILLTDGGASDSGLVDLTQQLNIEADVTTSVIAIGGENPGFLEQMAIQGGGNYHVAATIESIPTIFAQETVLATRSYIIEGEFIPARADLSPIIDGIDSLPPLYGYVAASAKQTAQVILVAPNEFNDPILTAWQYGLGRAVAFTSDATARWGRSWVTWDGFAPFWSQAVRWTILEGADANLETRVIQDGETARIVVDARDNAGAFLNGLALQTSLVVPNGARETTTLTLQQTAPGRYEATFTPESEGAYFLGVSETSPDDTSFNLNQTVGWVISYSPEYAARDTQASVLPALAALTNGRALTGEPALVFDHNLAIGTDATPLAPILLLAALLLLPLDIAVRRLVITASDIARLRVWLARGRAVEASDTLSGLREAKARAQERTFVETVYPSDGDVNGMPAPSVVMPPPTVASVSRPAADDGEASPPSVAPVDGNLAGRLLQKRRGRDEQ